MSQSTDKLKEHVGGRVQQTPFEQLRQQLIARRGDFIQLLGQRNVDKFIEVVLTAVTKNPNLLGADRPSLFFAAKAAAIDKLMPDGKDAVFNIYSTKRKGKDGREVWVPTVQYLPMVRGLIKLLWETDLFTYIDGAAVYQHDHFRFTRGDDPKIEHEPYAGDDDPGPVRAAYVIVKLKTGEVKREVLYRRDIERARARSGTPNQGPWMSWYDQMAIKTAFHRIFKQLPGVPDAIEGVFDRDQQAMVSGSFGADVLELPEHAGGEPVPTQAVPTDRENEPVPATQAAQAEQAGAVTGSQPPKQARDPGPSQAPGGPTWEDVMVCIRQGDYPMARDIARGLGVDAAENCEREIVERASVKVRPDPGK